MSSRSTARALAALLTILASGACTCDGTETRKIDPCELGSVTGRACAPDRHTWVGGAQVKYEGNDCRGMSMEVHATSDADGTFKLEGVPAGTHTVTVTSGSFVSRYDVTIAPGQSAEIPDDKLCFARDAAKIAVIGGKGDHIETLLGSMGLNVAATFDGSSTGWSSGGKAFLLDRAKMGLYDVIFIDCAAALNSGKISLGSSSDTSHIVDNLRFFVENGGSVYASDWAFLFLALAWPDQVQVMDPVNEVRAPFPTNELQGFAPQTIEARVSDPGLAQALGKSTVTVAFPYQSGAESRHWGLLEDAGGGATALLEGTAKTCASSVHNQPLLCDQAGPPAVNVPLAITFTPAPPSHDRQGRVTYTSFHNIAQPTGDVEAILRYLVFRL